MELKLRVRRNLKCESTLLIVPYGIETIKVLFRLLLVLLLIVPYGIETTKERK